MDFAFSLFFSRLRLRKWRCQHEETLVWSAARCVIAVQVSLARSRKASGFHPYDIFLISINFRAFETYISREGKRQDARILGYQRVHNAHSDRRTRALYPPRQLTHHLGSGGVSTHSDTRTDMAQGDIPRCGAVRHIA